MNVIEYGSGQSSDSQYVPGLFMHMAGPRPPPAPPPWGRETDPP